MAIEKPATNERPKYRITAVCYINDKIIDPETMPLMEADDEGERERKPLIIAYDGIPGWYMEPINDSARAMCEKHKARMVNNDPIASLTIVTGNQTNVIGG